MAIRVMSIVCGTMVHVARRLGVNIPGVNKSGIGREFIMTTCGYTYNIP